VPADALAGKVVRTGGKLPVNFSLDTDHYALRRYLIAPGIALILSTLAGKAAQWA
jgi:hypothetical protein